LVCATIGVVILQRRKRMADPQEEKIEKKLEEEGAIKQDSELSESDVENVAGGSEAPKAIDTFK
jgi:hypothetical protein